MSVTNLFHYATSELSQDAFICYLLAWADEAHRNVDPALHCCAQKFVSVLICRCGVLGPEQIHTVEVHRQQFHLDILAKINDDTVLGIEDKTWTKSHGTQLNDYHAALKEEYREHEICLVYLKTGNENPRALASYQVDGFHSFGRTDLLAVLSTYAGSNTVVTDFRARLQELEDRTNAFQDKPVDDWDHWQWQGFYNDLYHKYNDLGWDYVANPSGGFMGAWWHGRSNEHLGVSFYLQFEQDKLCIKMEDSDGQVQECWKKYRLLEIMNEKCAAFPHLAQNGYRLRKPGRFGSGTYVTIGIVESERSGNGGMPRRPDGTVHLDDLFQVTDQLCNLVDQLETVAL